MQGEAREANAPFEQKQHSPTTRPSPLLGATSNSAEITRLGHG
jgi:hypothetical protein